MSIGYIYVLVNSSMPDILKVGYSSRLPSERARELGASTGVPVPFVVAYECRVSDCRRAEEIVHSRLQARGFRVAENREFFRAPVTEAVNAILTLPDDLLIKSGDERIFLSPLTASEDDSSPWLDIWEHAESLHFGINGEIQDDEEAMNLYTQAAQLGCSWPYFRMSQIIYSSNTGKGVVKTARRFAIDGVKARNYSCYLILSRISANEEFNLAEIQRRRLLDFSEAQDYLNRMFELRQIAQDSKLEFALNFQRTLICLLRDVPELLPGLNQFSRKSMFFIRDQLIEGSDHIFAKQRESADDPELLELLVQQHAELKSFLQDLAP